MGTRFNVREKARAVLKWMWVVVGLLIAVVGVAVAIVNKSIWEGLIFLVPMLVPAGLCWMLWWPDVAAARARRAHLCRSCGYDRRGLASPTAKCPECGAIANGQP